MISTRRIIARCARLAVPLSLAASGVLFAQSITIGLSGDITAFDPHYHNVGPNNSSVAHTSKTTTVNWVLSVRDRP